ncbi:iron uptake system protein EfeO [Halomonas sp. HP20-15]|uniref:iron uptake system protein EfeO n=1 Tax=Halomonas sp. HP20-15 TaxID=3085901 RepID=UPI0029821E9F|nr:iron uptake system protein EfeO [Halomonas sp. HP20-15]MDW5375827.1 iron uptake system protein EfeO [Halomonas sp. HP20-15]
MSRSASSQQPSTRLLRLGVALAALITLAALALFYVSLRHADDAPDDAATTVTVTASGCQPNDITVPAGRTTFLVINHSPRAIEWEILDGVMVLEERENIAPELRQPLTATLTPGDYAMTCGLLSNPRGTLHVVASGDADAAMEPLSRKAFIAPLAEYSVYLTLQTRELKAAAQALHKAIVADDLDAARASYRQARLADQRLAMAIGLFSDLDQRINARAEYFAKRQQDPAFGGFHRLALGLYQRHSTAGLAPVAAQLVDDIEALAQRFKDQAIPPAQLASGSARVLQAWHDHQPTDAPLDERERADLRGLTQGAGKIVALLAPLLERQAPDMLATLNTRLAALHADLEAPPKDDPQALLEDAGALAETLGEVNAALALNA